MTIQPMTPEVRGEVIAMMEVFYKSPAVFTDGSREIFERDVDACLEDNPYLEGYVFKDGETVCGYAMVAKSFSTEFGKPCLWIEDLYIKEVYRGRGMGKQFLAFADRTYPRHVIRLEVEAENTAACHVYKKAGFGELPYLEMIKR